MPASPIKTWSTPVAEEGSRTIPCALCGGERFLPALSCEGFAFVRCARCGLVQRNPQPTSEAVSARYRERHGDDYLDYELSNETAFLRLQNLALADIGFDREARGSFLDVGCATGALIAELRGAGWRTAGVELCAQSADYARRERGLDVRPTAIERAGLEAGGFDVVHASHLIEHLNDPRSFVREARRILKLGGTLLVATPNIAGFQARLFASAWRSAIFDHLYLFSKRTLRALLESEGFRVERTATWGGLAAGSAPAALKAVADRAVKKIGAGDVMMMRAVAE